LCRLGKKLKISAVVVQQNFGPIHRKLGYEPGELWNWTRCAFLLAQTCYVSEIDSGQLTLRNLRLKRGALDKFRLPVDVLEGKIPVYIPKMTRMMIKYLNRILGAIHAISTLDESGEPTRTDTR
jgi:hypothetical protein